MRDPYKICKRCAHARVLPDYCICRRYGSNTLTMQHQDFCGYWKVRELPGGIL